MQQSLLKVVNLTKKYYNRTIINNLNFEVGHNEFHAFVGANGAGKTTTIKLIIGAYQKYKGAIYLNGILNKIPKSKKYFSYIPEIAKFPSRLTVFQYLYYMISLNETDKKTNQSKINDFLINFNMDKFKNHKLNSLSSGQKKKILLIHALLNNPNFIIMDEPTDNLDPKTRLEFLQFCKTLQKNNCSILMSSHVLTELDRYADAVTILDGGKIVFSGKKSDYEHKNNNFWKIKIKASFLAPKFNNYPINQQNEIITTFNNTMAMKKLINDLIDANIFVSISKQSVSIEDLYQKYVIKGSVG